MANKGNRGAALRVTALTAALLGVYGVAGAEPITTLVCTSNVCTPEDPKVGSKYSATAATPVTGDAYVVQIINSTVTLTDVEVEAKGHKMRGIGSHSGSTLQLERVTVTTDATVGNPVGWSGHGVQAWGPGSTVNINNSEITTGGASYSLGIHSQKDGVVTGTNNRILTTAKGSSGLEVDRNGTISLTKGTITTKGEGAAGVRALSGKEDGATRGFITLDGTTVLTEGVGAIGLMAGDEDGDKGKRTAGDITFKNGSVTTKETGAYAARVQNGSNLILDNSTLTSEKAHGLLVGDIDGKGDIKNNKATVTKTTINTGGKHGVYVTEGSATLGNSSVISTSTIADAKAVTADHGASVTVSDSIVQIGASGQKGLDPKDDMFVVGVQALDGGSIVLDQGTSVVTTGAMAFGLRSTIDRSRTPISTAISSIKASSIAVQTAGAGSHAMAAYWDGTIGADNTRVTTTGADAFGAHARDGGKVTLTNSSITTSGARSMGAVAEAANKGGAKLQITNSTISTTGESAHGIQLRGGGSSASMTGGSITATGKGSAGVFASNTSTATLTGVKLTSAGPSIISRFNSSGATQTITLGSDTYLTENNGTLLRVDRESGGANGTVNLTLNAGSFASGNILDKDATGKVKVTKNGGNWAGIVVDSSTTTVAPDTAPAENFNTPGSVSIAASSTGSGPTTFTGDTSIGGSVSLDPSASTVFQGSTTIAGDLAGQQGASTQFSGATTISQSVTGAPNSTFSFSGPSTTIGGSIAGAAGSSMTFAGGATIGGNVEGAGDGGSFVFSQTAPTSIGGNVQLEQGASLRGGTVGTPITIAGAAVVNSGAVLGGNLVVTGPLSGTGGTLSPGNSVGTQRYGTSGEFSGAYVAEVNATGQSDLIIIDNGNLNLAGVDLAVSQENGNGGYVLNHDYTIVQTVNGNVEGTFKSAELDSTFAGTLVNLDPVKYSQKDAKIRLSVDTSKVSAKRAGLSANQNATLDGVLSVAGQNASADAALLSTETGSALNQLSGEVHASTQSALLNSSSLLTNTIAKRMRGNVGAGMVAGAPVAQSSGSLPAGAMPSSTAYPLWAEVVGNWSSLDGDNNAAKVKSDTAGLFLGGDVGVGNGWRLGATLGFTDGKIKVNDRSSRSDVRSYTAAVYGGNSWTTGKGSVNFLAGAGYTRHDIDSRRTVTIGGNQTLKADYKANTTHLFTELGYAMPVGNASVVEPYLGVAWISQRAKGFSESGGSAALSGQSQTDTVTTFTLGARGKTTVEAGRHEVRLSAGAGWRHASGDVDASRKMSFIQGNGATFQIAGAPIAKDAAVVDLGAEMTVGKNAAMGLAYSGQFGNGNTDSTGSLYLKYRFK